MCSQIAVDEFEHGLFLRDRLITGDGSGDDHIATIVEGEQQVWKPLVAVLLEIPSRLAQLSNPR